MSYWYYEPGAKINKYILERIVNWSVVHNGVACLRHWCGVFEYSQYSSGGRVAVVCVIFFFVLRMITISLIRILLHFISHRLQYKLKDKKIMPVKNEHTQRGSSSLS